MIRNRESFGVGADPEPRKAAKTGELCASARIANTEILSSRSIQSLSRATALPPAWTETREPLRYDCHPQTAGIQPNDVPRRLGRRFDRSDTYRIESLAEVSRL